jgi:hypothetical protein
MTVKAVAPSCSEVLRLRPGVYRAVDRAGREYLLHRSASQQLGRLTDLERGVLRQLAQSACAGESMRSAARDSGGDGAVAELDGLLRRLRTGGWLHITVARNDRLAYTIEPHRRPSERGSPRAVPARSVPAHAQAPSLPLSGSDPNALVF